MLVRADARPRDRRSRRRRAAGQQRLLYHGPVTAPPRAGTDAARSSRPGSLAGSLRGPELPIDDDPLPGQVGPPDVEAPDREPIIGPAEAMGLADGHRLVDGLEHADRAGQHAALD